ncbi:MAG TPA: thioredoxin fold domain-containing protein [Spirochaetota bacterium]|nr:thioredoxin fold domain-containing protein [Spirochaetota bacterium]HPI90878.1 thioredoxin fold domain-containing protein [Spirochaetota bacterium]HPR48112.1 thioredoxin fold domain-containing protein [Spirochaetota bacterium]
MQRTISISLMLLVILIAGPRSGLPKQAPTWHDYDSGIKLAKKTKKPVVVDFYAEWCKWCKVMDEKTFNDPDVAKKLVKDYICIRIDTMSNKTLNFKNHRLTPQQFAQITGATGLPTVLFMDSDENIITRIPGYIDKNVFYPLLGYINDKCYLKNVSFEDYKNGKIKCGR